MFCVWWRECRLVSSFETNCAIGVSIGCGVAIGIILSRMSGRGRGKAGGRRGRWSNCGRYWKAGNDQSSSSGQPTANPAQYNGAVPVVNPYPPGVNPVQYAAPFQAPAVMPIMPPPTASAATPPTPMQYQAVAPQVSPWGMQPWQWPAHGQWAGQPPSVQAGTSHQQSIQSHQQPLNQQASTSHNTGVGNNPGKGPTTNSFPGPGNRAYFTKEYMDILEDIKMSKAIEEARKKISSGRRGGVRIVELPDEGSRSEGRFADKARSTDKSDEMKAWVTSTLGDSLKLITEKLQEVDQKAKLVAADKAELDRLREEKALKEKGSMDPASNEKRKRGGECTPAANSPRINRVKSCTCGSSKAKSRSKRIEVSSNEEETDTMKHNLQPKMGTSSELATSRQSLLRSCRA
ncbi:hypothetical protein CBR_g31077 [Chara braunii]|uniref:Uncharacterized protein n=1 Tax=Chara braunii TaxID=69332 RepID=A0A388LEC5_CHABU|nr:hypothetical protein CBR_g31077 [Chara braunii]|eukprot:GBG80617.1 hypothetical protein CBR_g31077 [Chara braunii]